MATPAFTDVHCHPDLKTFLSANDEANRIDCRQNITMPLILKIIDRVLLGNIIESQSSLSQLDSSAGTIGLVGLYAFEKAMIRGDLIRFLGIHINLLTAARILDLMGYRGKIDHKLLKRISSPRSRYFNLFNEMQKHLLAAQAISPGFKILKNISDYDPLQLNLVLTIEGGHNLFNRRCFWNQRRDVLVNLNDLKTRVDPYLFMSPAHLERNRLCAHAFGIKILQHRRFKPVGQGITSLGRKVIKESLMKPGRILIDIKHMSLVSRKQYYEMLDTELASEGIPILVSHGGVTGVSWDNMPVVSCRNSCRWAEVEYSQPDGLSGTKFNPWSINLYDEEIIKIVDSNGLIGLNLDERILGTKQKRRSERIEFFPRKEFNCRRYRMDHPGVTHLHEPEEGSFENDPVTDEIRTKLLDFIRLVVHNPYRFRDLDTLYDEIVILYNQLPAIGAQNSDNGIKHLCNNILHIVKVAGDRAWKNISIGSDFDGLINTIDNCRNATEINKLALDLRTWLPAMTQNNPSFSPITNIPQKVGDIISGNAYEFLKRNFI